MNIKMTSALFEDVINHTIDKYGGISKVNAAGRALHDFMTYVSVILF